MPGFQFIQTTRLEELSLSGPLTSEVKQTTGDLGMLKRGVVEGGQEQNLSCGVVIPISDVVTWTTKLGCYSRILNSPSGTPSYWKIKNNA